MTKLLLAIFFCNLSFALSKNDNFECPNMVRSCFCYPDLDQSLEIYCTTNSSTGSNHYLRIHRRSQVTIQCTNSPSWSDFLFGSTVLNASPSELYFSGCVPPGKMHEETFRKQLDIFNVQFLKFNNLKGTVTPDDLEGFPESTYLSLSNNNLGEVDAELLRGNYCHCFIRYCSKFNCIQSIQILFMIKFILYLPKKLLSKMIIKMIEKSRFNRGFN